MTLYFTYFDDNRRVSCINNEYKANFLSESNHYSIRNRNLSKLVVAHLNMNSLGMKFDSNVDMS